MATESTFPEAWVTDTSPTVPRQQISHTIGSISPYSSSNLFLIGPKFDFTFTDKIFWTTFIQYNSQIENLNINSRFQWRFAPVSDIFLVYTDNYFAYNNVEGIFNLGEVKSRALVFKITYWFNL